MRDFDAAFDRYGSFSSDRPAPDALGMSAGPPIATELVTRGSPSLGAKTGPEQVQQIERRGRDASYLAPPAQIRT